MPCWEALSKRTADLPRSSSKMLVAHRGKKTRGTEYAPPNTPLWHKDYSELKATEKQQV